MLLGKFVVYPQPQQLTKVTAERLCLDPLANKAGDGPLVCVVEFFHSRPARLVQHRTSRLPGWFRTRGAERHRLDTSARNYFGVDWFGVGPSRIVAPRYKGEVSRSQINF